MFVYVVNFLLSLKKCLLMLGTQYGVTATIDGNVIGITYVGELEIHTVLTYHCATYSVWPGPLFIVL